MSTLVMIGAGAAYLAVGVVFGAWFDSDRQKVRHQVILFWWLYLLMFGVAVLGVLSDKLRLWLLNRRKP